MLAKRASAAPLDRRRFLIASASAGAGLVIGFQILPKFAHGAAPAAGPLKVDPNAFVRIAPDNTVTVLCKHIEFGQGTHTGLATIAAEELDADWSQVRTEHAPANAALYNNLHWGPVQGTGGSSAIANSYDQLRHAGAMAKAMLVAAAAEQWNVPAGEIAVAKGRLNHAGSGQSASFGELAELAAQQTPPSEVTLKDPKDHILIGKHAPRVDSKSKTTGQATYTIDVMRPGMLTTLIARPPIFGATVASFDATEALQMNGVEEVVAVPQGVAVVARDFWSASKGRDLLSIEWDESTGETRSSDQIMAEYRTLADQPGLVARQDGDSDAALASAAQVLESNFEFPFLAHAPMEPVNAVAEITQDGCEIWTGSQLQTGDQMTAAQILGLSPEKVTVHTLYAGGSFGRRATPDSDMVAEAVSVAKAIDGRAPVRVLWTREDDVQGGRYRPMYFHRLRAGLDEDGKLVAWQHRIVGQSILKGTPFEGMLVQNGIDLTSVEGANNLPYAIPNTLVDLHTTDIGVPVLWWRAVGSTHTAHSVEIFIDELAEAAGRDPVDFRRELLRDHPRHLGVMELAVEKSGWGEPLPAGKARGIAVHESFASFVAQVVEVSLDGGTPKIERVVCAVDCGRPINPDQIKAQMEGGIGYGLGAILHDEITLDGGRVEQSNFHDYVPLRIEEMPKVEVHIVPSEAAPTGVGEPGTPPIGPAVANALYQLTGERIRSLPLSKHELRGA